MGYGVGSRKSEVGRQKTEDSSREMNADISDIRKYDSIMNRLQAPVF